MKKQELMAKIEKAVENCKKLKFALDGHDNPQIIELCKRTEGKQEAFEAVLLALRGNNFWLDIEAN